MIMFVIFIKVVDSWKNYENPPNFKISIDMGGKSLKNSKSSDSNNYSHLIIRIL